MKPAIENLSEYLSKQGLKSTTQRDIIFNIFAEARQHLSADELYVRVKKINPGIGYATIYRTLRLLVKASLATECRFENGFTRFEYKNTNTRYDHLICTRCGVIVEFENERIEALQNGVARENRFRV